MYICISFSIRLYVFLNLYTCSCGNFSYVYTLHLHGWFFASKNADCALFQLGAALQIIIRNSCLWEKHFSKISWRGWHCGFMSVYVCPASWQACACALARRAGFKRCIWKHATVHSDVTESSKHAEEPVIRGTCTKPNLWSHHVTISRLLSLWLHRCTAPFEQKLLPESDESDTDKQI